MKKKEGSWEAQLNAPTFGAVELSNCFSIIGEITPTLLRISPTFISTKYNDTQQNNITNYTSIFKSIFFLLIRITEEVLILIDF